MLPSPTIPFLYSQEFCQLSHFPHQGQKEIPWLVELFPVPFGSKFCMEASAGIETNCGSPNQEMMQGSDRAHGDKERGRGTKGCCN